MNQAIYEHFNLDLREKKNLLLFVYLANKLNSSTNLGLTFKYNNIFVNKLISMRLNLNIYIYNIIYVCVNILI